MSTATVPSWKSLPFIPNPYIPQGVALTSTPVPAQTCSCEKSVAYSCERGETFSSQITLTLTDSSVTPPVKNPIDLTGSTFQFTAKPSQDTPDNDPATIIVDWQETTTPLQGTTWLTIPAATTHNMQTIAYVIQVRMVSPSGVVTPLVAGSLTITEPPASARYQTGPVVNPLGV
jgi:hypothetical protein